MFLAVRLTHCYLSKDLSTASDGRGLTGARARTTQSQSAPFLHLQFV